MTIYLAANEVLDINERFVGPDALRDFGLLDSAVMRPQACVFGEDAFPTLHEKAAALLHGLARNHPFLDGNKRTALAASAMSISSMDTAWSLNRANSWRWWSMWPKGSSTSPTSPPS